jgi:hypothetical protein
MTWTQGHDLARTPAYNAYLATINNADENQWVYLTFGKFAGQFFLGGNDGDTEGQWVWDENGANFFNGTYSAGSVVSPWFANWNSAEPNDAGGNENALVMINGSGLWNDLDVNHALPCLVESGTGHVNITGPLPSNVTLFPGDHYELTIQVRHPVGTPTFQWRLNGANIPGATTDRLVIQNASDVDAGDYTCMAGDQSTSDESGASHVTVLPDSAVPAQSLAAVMVLTLMLALLLVRYARIK